jgi:galactokinase
VDALRAGDWRTVGRLFYASHDSQRDDYEVSIPALDLLIDLARADSEVYGARLTGGGFGGSIVLIAHEDRGAAVSERLARAYAGRSGHKPTVLVPAARISEPGALTTGGCPTGR